MYVTYPFFGVDVSDDRQGSVLAKGLAMRAREGQIRELVFV